MREIHFTPNFSSGASYIAELWFNGDVVQHLTPIPNVQNTFIVTVPGTYSITVRKVDSDICTSKKTIEVLFPIVTVEATSVDCAVNRYQVIITLTNPTSAGSDIRYGVSLLNDRGTVANWQTSGNFTVNADSTPRFFFVKNNSGCILYVTTVQKDPCINCNLTVTNITFSCA